MGGESGLVLVAQQTAQKDQMPNVVGGVIGNEESFAQNGLAVSAGNFREEIGSGIAASGLINPINSANAQGGGR
jgi:hypothetical protein